MDYNDLRLQRELTPGKNNLLTIDGFSYIAGKDFTPMLFSSDNPLEAGVVFAGYGFSIKSDTLVMG